MTRITSEKHQIFVIMTNKVALSCFDDKRFILEPGLETLPHGHFWLKQKPPNNDQALSIPDDDDEQTSLNNFDESEDENLSDTNEKPSDKSSGAEQSEALGIISSTLDSFGELLHL